MAYILPFKNSDTDVSPAIFIANDQSISIICKIKMQAYDTCVIYPNSIDDDNEEITLTYEDKDNKIANLLKNICNSQKINDNKWSIADKLTIEELKVLFSTKKINIISGQKLYDKLLQSGEKTFIAKLIKK